MAQTLINTAEPEPTAITRRTSLADRLVRRFATPGDDSPRPAASNASTAARTGSATFPPRPTQLSLPLSGDDEDRDGPDRHDPAPPSLFRDARRIGSVLGYEQARLDQIIPNTSPPPGAPEDRLMRPGGIGLVLHGGGAGALAFDWMHWGGAIGSGAADAGVHLDPTVNIATFLKRGRAARKLAKQRCIIPLLRYSVPVRDGEMWAHRWISPHAGQIACAAGIWAADRDGPPRFALVTGHRGPAPEDGREGQDGPLLLAEEELLPWLRAPLDQALLRITRGDAA